MSAWPLQEFILRMDVQLSVEHVLSLGPWARSPATPEKKQGKKKETSFEGRGGRQLSSTVCTLPVATGA